MKLVNKQSSDFRPIERKKIENKNFLTIIILLGTLAVIGMTIICTSYVKMLNHMLQEETKTYLSEISSHEKIIFEKEITDNINRLQTVSNILNAFPDITSEECIIFLKDESVRYQYSSMFVSDKDGNCLTTDGRSLALIKEDYFQKAVRGKPAVSNTAFFAEGKDIIIYIVPVFKDGHVVGTLGAMYDMKMLQNVLSIGSFGGEGHFHVVTSQGRTVLADEDNNKINYYNIFTYLENAELLEGKTVSSLKYDFAKKTSGCVQYLDKKDSVYMGYTPMEVNDWYLLTFVPEKVVSQKSALIIKATIIIMLVISLIFILLIIYIVLLQRKSRKKLEQIAYVDEITKGANKAWLQLWAEENLEKNEIGNYCVVYSDIVKFKLINDTYGYQSGNKTLKYIYECIMKHLHQKEAAARVAADNFVMFMEYQSYEDTLQRLEHLYQDINCFNNELKNKYNLIFFVGIYVITDNTLGFSKMMDRANIARRSIVYRGGAETRYAFYSEAVRSDLVNETEIENKMVTSLENGEFEVYLQPKCDLKTNKTVGAEALVRWNDPDKGLLLPYLFVDLFEKNGFIVNVDRYVFEEVCQYLRGILDAGEEPLTISVNLSKAHLAIPDFLEFFETIREKYKVPPRYIEFELTESMVFQNMERLLSIIQTVHNYGYTCSMDDFGSGYSSLNMLKDIPVDVLKLDRGFFVGKDDVRSRAIISGILSIAKELGIKTVAEGVDTIEQRKYITEKGCDMMQAFIYARPMTFPEFNRFYFGNI